MRRCSRRASLRPRHTDRTRSSALQIYILRIRVSCAPFCRGRGSSSRALPLSRSARAAEPRSNFVRRMRRRCVPDVRSSRKSARRLSECARVAHPLLRVSPRPAARYSSSLRLARVRTRDDNFTGPPFFFAAYTSRRSFTPPTPPPSPPPTTDHRKSPMPRRAGESFLGYTRIGDDTTLRVTMSSLFVRFRIVYSNVAVILLAASKPSRASAANVADSRVNLVVGW